MITLILGRREVGKTTMGRYLTDQASLRIYFDPRALIPCDEPLTEIDQEDLWERLNSPLPSTVVYQPYELQASSDLLARLLTGWTRDEGQPKQIAVLIDEASLIDLRAWEWLVRCSPRDRCHLTFTCHRPRDLDTTIRALADTWLIFRTAQPHDLKAIEERCGVATVDAVSRLRDRQVAVWDDARGELRMLTNDKAWYVPVRSTSAGATVKLGEPVPAPGGGGLFD